MLIYNRENAMDIPYKRLRSETLQKLTEEFVLREGTDYGAHEYTLDQKVAQVKNQLALNLVKVVYDPALDSCSIIAVNT